MRRIAFRLAIVATAFTCLVLPLDAASPVFPHVTGQNLNGATFHLPADFDAPASFVYVAFTREQQAQIDTWKPFVTGIRRHASVGAFELPTLSRGTAFFRGFIEGGMRRGISDPEARATTITLYIDKGAFDASLGLASEADIAVLLVKPDGSVLWSARGAYDPAKSAGLDAALATIGD